MMIPFPNKTYEVIYADPPWEVKRGPDYGSNGTSRVLTYPTMSLEEIAALPVRGLANKDCRLFLWTINKYLPQTFSILARWGFTYSTTLVWVKSPNGIGLGGTFSLTTEFLLFAYKGKCAASKRFDSTWWLEKRGKHSQKPEKFRQLIEAAFPIASKIELFARQQTPGWDVWGNEVEVSV